MTALFLESPYSFLFYDLRKKIAPSFAHVFYFSLGHFFYNPSLSGTFVRAHLKKENISSDVIEKIKSIPSIANSNIRKPRPFELAEMAQFYIFLENYVRTNKITHIFCHNDLRWQHAIAKDIAVANNIKTIFFEEGYFRPDTISIDNQGLNAFSSLPRNPDFYLSKPVETGTLKNFRHASFLKRISRIAYFNIFLFLNCLGTVLQINTRTKNKKYSFASYLKLFMSKVRSSSGTSTTTPAPLPRRYVFAPLQVSEDTQTVIHSPFSGTQECIELIEKTFFALPESLRQHVSLVFKKHPMEAAKNYRFDERSIVLDSDTTSLIKSCLGIVCINSSTIAQCLSEKKTVIALGNSFFDIEGLVVKSNATRLASDFQDLLLGTGHPINTKLLEHFLSFLKYKSQFNMNLFYYSHDDLRNLIDTMRTRNIL